MIFDSFWWKELLRKNDVQVIIIHCLSELCVSRSVWNEYGLIRVENNFQFEIRILYKILLIFTRMPPSVSLIEFVRTSKQFFCVFCPENTEPVDYASFGAGENFEFIWTSEQFVHSSCLFVRPRRTNLPLSVCILATSRYGWITILPPLKRLISPKC